MAEVTGLAEREQPSQVAAVPAASTGLQVEPGDEMALGTFGGPIDSGFHYMEGVSDEFAEVEGDIPPLGEGISTEWGAMEGDEDFLPMPSGEQETPEVQMSGEAQQDLPPTGRGRGSPPP